MTPAGAWTIGLALAFTFFLIGAGQLAKRRSTGSAESFFVGGRKFGPFTVAFCITGLFSGSSFIAIVELSYQTGVSAVWYGVAETVQVLLIALVLIAPFRQRMIVTISGLIGDHFGRGARALAGAITAVAFPMWSVATALAFASALYAFTGLSIYTSVLFTALLLLLYLSSGGMWSVAFTQTANCVVFVAMFAVGIGAFLINPGLSGLASLGRSQPEFVDWTGVGLPLIIAWFGTFVVNVILAQATFQMALSCRTPEEGRRGLLYAAGFGLPFIILGVVLGMAAAIVVPNESLGLVAVPHYIAQVLPAPLVGVFFLGVWACTLGWGAPCQFSGATSLGRDVGQAINPKATDAQLVRYTRWSLVVLTGLMIAFGFLRSEQSAWWNVLAWTLRNGSTLAPVLGALLWPLATRRAVYAALGTGFLSGIGWNQLSGWAPDSFYLGVHPVWIGMTVNILVLVIATLVEQTGSWRLGSVSRAKYRVGASATATAFVVAIVATWRWEWLHERGLTGLTMFGFVFFAALAVFSLTRGTRAPATDTIDQRVERRDQADVLDRGTSDTLG